MPEIDFDREFSRFVASGESSTVTDIYDILPTLSDGQIKTINTLRYYISKYDLTDLQAYLLDYLETKARNKNLSFMSSMNVKSLLRARSMEEYIKGINISSMNRRET